MSPWRLGRARRVLEQGGIIAYPTEAVWGLGCDPWDADAVRRLIGLKGRDARQGIILVAADCDQLNSVVSWPPAAQAAQVRGGWPGFVTWVLRAAPSVPALVTGGRETVAVRVSAHPVVRDLCRAFGGPLVSTSANPHGLPPARTALGVRRYFPRSVDLIVPGRLGPEAGPSPIRDAETGGYLRY